MKKQLQLSFSIVSVLSLISLLRAPAARAQFSEWYQLNGPFDIRITSVTDDKLGNLYVAADSTFYRNTGFFWEPAFTLHGVTPTNTINTLFVTPNGSLLQGNSKSAIVSTNAGQTWADVTGLSSATNCFAIDAGNTIYASTKDGLFSSSNGGQSFTLADGSSATTVHASTNGNILFVSGGTVSRIIPGQTGHVAIGGATVQNAHLASDKHGNVYVGGQSTGVLRAQSPLTIFQSFDNILKSETVTGLLATEGDTLLASTLDSGVYFSTDQGATWQEFFLGLDTRHVTSLSFSQQGFLYAGTVNDGVYRSDKVFTPVKFLPASSVKPEQASANFFQFVPSTRSFSFTTDDPATITIFDLLGRTVQTIDSEYPQALSASLHGPYIAELHAGSRVQMLKIVVGE